MKKHISGQPRKGVAPWMMITILVAVLALVVTLVPNTFSQSRAADKAPDIATVAEVGELSEVDASNSEVTDVIGDTPTVKATAVEIPVTVESPENIEEPVVEEPNLLKQALDLFAPAPAAIGIMADRSAEVTVTVNVAEGQYNIGDDVRIAGSWRFTGTDPDLLNGDSFRIAGPELLRIVDEAFELVGSDSNSWGTCTPVVADNYYNCEITDKPSNLFGGSGLWQATATAEEAGTRTSDDGKTYEVLPGADFLAEITKTGSILNNASAAGLNGAPAGSVLRYNVELSASDMTLVNEDIVISDVFSENLRLCTDDTITNLQISQPFSALTATIAPVGTTGFNITIPRPAAGFSNAPIYLQYSLCATSGGRDASGTVYVNTVESEIQNPRGEDVLNIDSTYQLTQIRSASGTADGVLGGSFDLKKIIDSTKIPAGFDPATTAFTVKVSEFAPGQYPGGTAEVNYDLSVLANGATVSGFNARPAGWTIVLSEPTITLPAIPGHDWDTPVFTGTGITTGVDNNGDSFAVVTTLDPGLEQNVAVELENFPTPRTPEVKTQALVSNSPSNILALTGGEVTDVVTYKNLKPNTAYVLRGTIMNDAGVSTGITGTGTFTTGDAPAGGLVDGTANVIFTLTGAQAESYAGKKLVVFEELAEAATPTVVVAEHKDLNDTEQTFWVERKPTIGTTALVSGSEDNILALTGGEVVDTVAYTDLKPSTTYKLDGTIMYTNTAGAAVSTGITSTAEFTTPAGEGYVSGTTTVSFTISASDAARFAGQDLVVFERLYLGTDLVAVHEDKDDEDQTFEVERKPSIGTTAKVEGADDNVLSLEGGTVTDTVAYTNLKAGTQYRISGEIMHVAADGTVTATGVAGEATFTTPAGTGYVSGTQDVVFTVPAAIASAYEGEKLVVFESLYGSDSETPIAEHKDKDDVKQTFWIDTPPEVIVKKKVTGPKGDDVTADEDAVFQIRASWVDKAGVAQSRTYTVRPDQEVSLEGLPLNTEITLSETGAQTSVSNVKWGDVIWSGTGVVDEAGSSRDAVVTLENAEAPIRINLENKTSSSGLIIIPIPITPPTSGSPAPPTVPTTPIAPPTATAIPATPTVPATPIPAPKVKASAPQTPAKSEGLAMTGANVAWLALGGILVLLLGAALVLRGRRKES